MGYDPTPLYHKMPCRGCVSSFGLELIGWARTTAAKLLGLYLTNGGTPTLDQDQRTDTSALVGHEARKWKPTKSNEKTKSAGGLENPTGRGNVPERPGKYGTGSPGTRSSSGDVFRSPREDSGYVRL